MKMMMTWPKKPLLYVLGGPLGSREQPCWVRSKEICQLQLGSDLPRELRAQLKEKDLDERILFFRKLKVERLSGIQNSTC